MLNQTAEYALRAATSLAGRAPDELVQAAELAEELDVPANYLSKILHQLAAAGVLESRRGRGGGFRLAVPAGALSLVRVVAPFDSVGAERRCVLGGAVCSDRNACAAHERWKPISTALHEFLRDTTVSELARRGPRITGPRRGRRAGARSVA